MHVEVVSMWYPYRSAIWHHPPRVLSCVTHVFSSPIVVVCPSEMYFCKREGNNKKCLLKRASYVGTFLTHGVHVTAIHGKPIMSGVVFLQMTIFKHLFMH